MCDKFLHPPMCLFFLLYEMVLLYKMLQLYEDTALALFYTPSKESF